MKLQDESRKLTGLTKTGVPKSINLHLQIGSDLAKTRGERTAFGDSNNRPSALLRHQG